MVIYCIYFVDSCFDKNFTYKQGILFKIILSKKKKKNKRIIIENTLSMQMEKSSSGQMFWISKTI